MPRSPPSYCSVLVVSILLASALLVSSHEFRLRHQKFVVEDQEQLKKEENEHWTRLLSDQSLPTPTESPILRVMVPPTCPEGKGGKKGGKKDDDDGGKGKGKGGKKDDGKGKGKGKGGKRRVLSGYYDDDEEEEDPCVEGKGKGKGGKKDDGKGKGGKKDDGKGGKGGKKSETKGSKKDDGKGKGGKKDDGEYSYDKYDKLSEGKGGKRYRY